MVAPQLPLSDFVRYLASRPPAEESLPPLATLSAELGVSVASLREQLEVARAMGLVEVKPRVGIRRLPYSFLPAVQHSLRYALLLDSALFERFADMRKHLENAFWHEAVALLAPEDHQTLQALIASAWEKLEGRPIQIPHEEHKQLHLTIYARLNNPFVNGILEAYWQAYESIGLNVFTDYDYLRQVWSYHEKIVQAICAGDFETGYRAQVEHANLLNDLLDHRVAR
jgi:DNA-binding FadR family transcriptional regulator